MGAANYDVVIVGGGAAGLTAAIGLAKSGFTVAVVEAAAYPGAENWSGCVYFCENLAHPDILGLEAVESLAWERRLVERGAFATDGHSLLGMTYRDPKAFRYCYTVLRPVFDHHMGQVAARLGVALLTDTTAESLIRDSGRVVGVCTQRGPLYADLVFLAEGDASHLVTREGYERYTDPREAPKFLQGIKQVIELPPGAIEDAFGLGPEEGAAYEMLVRNGSLRGQSVRLNMGGFVYTNRQSLSIGLVLPADNLKEHFGGDPNLLMEWFENLSVLRPWLKGGKRGPFGAKIIRGGGARDIPRLIDDGLAVGGAASAIGIDFPYPNFTGPATMMGLLLVQAARRIREEKKPFSRDALQKHYLERLQHTHYWKDVDFLRRWPGYVKRTSVFFGRNLDLALGSAYVWTRPRRWFVSRWFNWVRLVWQVAGPAHWHDLRVDQRHLARALRFDEVIGRPGLGRLLLDGAVNALRDLFRRPRADLAPAGILRLHYSVAGGAEPTGPASAVLRRWFRRFTPVLASAARRLYTNDTEPLAEKLHGAFRLMLRQVNMLDLFAIGGLTLMAGLTGILQLGWDRLIGLFRKQPADRPARGVYPRYAQAARQATDLTPLVQTAAQNWEGRLGRLAYETVKDSHIHVLWPRSIAGKNAVVQQGLWHVCPAHVYEARLSPQGQLQVVVNFENCIKCETCWRTSDIADWGRDGRHRFIYPVHTPVVTRLLGAAAQAGLARPALPHRVDTWDPLVRELDKQFKAERPASSNGQSAADVAELLGLLDKLDRKLAAFDESLAEEPRTVDRARAEYLEMLARHAQQLAARIADLLRGGALAGHASSAVTNAQRQLVELAAALLQRAEDRARRTWDQRYSWAAANGRHMRFHHMAGMRRILQLVNKYVGGLPVSAESGRAWLQAELVSGRVVSGEWSSTPTTHHSTRTTTPLGSPAALTTHHSPLTTQQTLDAVFPPTIWRDLERQASLAPEQDAVLRDLLAQVPAVDSGNLAATLHPPIRKTLLAELGRRDPSLAYRAACHLWARDLARLATGSGALSRAAQRWARGDEWACFATVDAVQTSGSGWTGDALFVPAQAAASVLLLIGNQLAVLPVAASERRPGLHVEPLRTLGLRGAGLTRVRLDGLKLPEECASVDHDRIVRAWSVLSAADLTSIAFGMADQLCRRTIAHAANRVQFPGLFHDEEARDTIGKFGAVKKMVAEMAARRLVIETLDWVVSPADFSAPSVTLAGLVKLVAAEALGTAPGSLSYNAGQVFGGTGYSEDDILAKFYRDASAWRFLGPANAAVCRQHGDELLRTWRPDGSRLAALRGEAEAYDELAQRKALQAELDEVRVVRSRLRGLVNEWLAAADPARSGVGGRALSSRASAEVSEGLARQDAHLLASKALLLRLHGRLEEGMPSEVETALLRVWLEGAAVALEEFEGALRLHFSAVNRRDEQPIVEPGAGAPLSIYADFLKAPAPYDSGMFLETPVDLVQPRLVPEMVEADPTLAAHNREFCQLLAGHFGQPTPDGLPYERYIERQHRPDAADIDFCRRHGFFRMPIPQELGGEGRSKLDYYLLTTGAQRLADVGISLLIQANSSIGSTPVLLARDKDLPKAQKELGPFVGDTSVQTEIRRKLEELVALCNGGSPKRLETAYRELNRHLEEAVLGRGALRVLAHRFGEAWAEAGRAGKAFDLPAFKRHLEDALTPWNEACARAQEYHGELARRRQACDLFLQWVAAGQISAFALTEPSAGSDTARVATRAVLRSVPLEAGPNGTYRFTPFGSRDLTPSPLVGEGRGGGPEAPSTSWTAPTAHPNPPPQRGREPKILLDASRLEFRSEETAGEKTYQAYYRFSDSVPAAPIRFDEYDYETDDPHKYRYFEVEGRKVHFTDIAQVRQRDGQSWYDYWELSGAKMWITNGRMCGIMALYAKTEEGITGFVVDRHAEGLLVGKDEEKLGQCGSPTNELSLQAVRVPRENVIGLEGRGQVNALETLNVGRAGLAMSSMTQMQGLIEASRAFAQSAHGEVPDWVAWRLERMQEERFTSEALAFEVIGRFEHSQTKSVRMESAISKALVSESLHRVIELAEEVHGLAGQTQLHLVEKRKRDARVLNIYEGTNEVQRFLILKDMVGAAAGKKTADERKTSHTGREALDLEALRLGVRQRLDNAVALFGQEVWQNPNLQANCFLLSEAAAWLKAADSTLGRLAWLSRQDFASSEEAAPDAGAASAAPPPRTGDWSRALDIGARAFARCCAEVRERLQRLDEELAHLRRGYYAPAIRAASLLFDQAGAAESVSERSDHRSRITRPLSVLVVVEPTAAAVPHPYLQDGRLLEPHWTLSDADRAALETALRLRDQAGAGVTIQVVAVAPRAAAGVLREALSLGADRVRLVAIEGEAVAPASAAAALAALLRHGTKFDVVLGGSSGPGLEEGLTAALTAEALGIAVAGSAARLLVRHTDAESEGLLVAADQGHRTRALPLAVGIEPGLTLRPFTVHGYLTGLTKPVETERWPRRVPAQAVTYLEGTPAEGTVEVPPGQLSAREAAGRVFEELGLRAGKGSAERPYEGPIEEVAAPTALENGIVAVLAADGEGRLEPTAANTFRAARLLADLEGVQVAVLLLTASSEDAQRRALGQLRGITRNDVVLLPTDNVASAAVRSQLLSECWPTPTTPFRAVVGEPWTEPALAALAGRAGTEAFVALRVRRLAFEGDLVLLETGRARGKMLARQVVPSGGEATRWITLTAGAEVSDNRSAVMSRLKPFSAEALKEGRVQRWLPRLERFYGRADIQRLLQDLKAETGITRLADADFIIDVGFGVGNRDGYEAVIEPLEKALRHLGVHGLMIGGSRKVTEELHLLPADRQIGQSGVSVAPRLLLAIGISGAPQHLNYIGAGTVILAFNRDPEAPLLTLNRRQPRPRVFPVIGDLFETVPAFSAALGQEAPEIRAQAEKETVGR